MAQVQGGAGPKKGVPANVPPANRAPANRAPANDAQDGVQIALIDIVRVFKNHPGFTQQLEVVKADFAVFQKDMVAKRNKVASDQQKLADFVVGSQEYKNADAAVMQQMSDIQVTAQLKKKEVQLEEAQIYFGAYNEVQAEVQKVAARFGIDLVLRFDGSKIDPNNPESVMQGVHRPVVYQNGLDITDLVLEGLAANYPPTASLNNGPPRTSGKPAKKQ